MPRVCLARLRSASRVSHPRGGFLRSDLPGLFRPGSACGVWTLQSFFLSRSRCTSRCPMPSWCRRIPDAPLAPFAGVVTRQAMARTRSTPGSAGPSAGCAHLQGLAPLENSLPSSGGLGRSGPDALLGLLLFRDFTIAPGTAVLAVRLPWASAAPPSGDSRRRLATAAALRSIPARRVGRFSLETGRPS